MTVELSALLRTPEGVNALAAAAEVADRVVMLYPLSRVEPGGKQVLYDGPPDGLESAADERVRQFVAGDARAESAKRVASAVGEGAMAVMLVHRYLEGL